MNRHTDVPQSTFRRQNFEKEQSIRVKWRANYGEAQQKRANDRIDQHSTDSIRNKIVTECVPQVISGKGRVLPVINYPKKSESEAMFLLRLQKQYKELYGDTPDTNMSNMKPVDEVTRKSLYDGLSREGEGRYQYLKARKQIIPEKKYDWPMTSQFDYGWKIGEQMNYQTPKASRVKVIQASFYRSTGVINSAPEDASLSMAM